MVNSEVLEIGPSDRTMCVGQRRIRFDAVGYLRLMSRLSRASFEDINCAALGCKTY